ncbi:MAG: serine/threonine protein kinase, partial [Planctomycetaceae bacterium]
MPETDSSFQSDDPNQTLTVLEEFLTRFLEAWEADPPPEMREFLPETGAVRRLTLTELIKVDLEYRWRIHKLPKRLDEYCREFPELLAGGIPPDLVYEEFHILKQAGEKVDARDYITAFPDQDTEIACLLGLDRDYASTALFKDAGKAELSNIEPGQRLDDFELLARLGTGAFAHVYLARQVSMQRLVAVKISADHGTEPQTLAQLDH